MFSIHSWDSVRFTLNGTLYLLCHLAWSPLDRCSKAPDRGTQPALRNQFEAHSRVIALYLLCHSV